MRNPSLSVSISSNVGQPGYTKGLLDLENKGRDDDDDDDDDDEDGRSNAIAVEYCDWECCDWDGAAMADRHK